MFKKENLRKNFLRVKQIADQNLGRVEKTEVLSDDLQSSEKKVEQVKHVSSNTVKKLGASLIGAGTSDTEKRLKKMPEAGLGHSMIESASYLTTDCIMGQMYQICGDCQNSLAQQHLQYEINVERNVLEPLQYIVENDIPQISKFKKALNKVTLDMDSAKSRHQNAVRQTQSPGVNMVSASQKCDNLKEEVDDTESRVEQAKDAYTTGMFNFISKEAEQSQNLLNFLEAQASYHQAALDIIQKYIPKMQESLSCNPVKPVYGVQLEEHLRVTNRDIAQVLEACVCFLLEFGLEEEGLFRIAGMASKVKKLKASFDAGIDFEDSGELDPHTVAGALKQYLRELPEPLLTYKLFKDFMAAAQQTDNERLQDLWRVVDRLPKPNYDNFRYLIKFLSKLTEKSEVNKMTPGNIAIVIGPNLIWSEGDNGPNMMNTGILSLITELIVQHADWFFPGDLNFTCVTPQDNGSPQLPKPTETRDHSHLERTGSNQSGSSHGTPQSSPAANQDTASPVTPASGSRSPSVSPAVSNSNLQGAPLAESEDLHQVIRRPTRKPAPPPPERPYSVAVSASMKPSEPLAQFQTWPRQAVAPQGDSSPSTLKRSDKQKTLPPDRPNPPDRLSSFPQGSQSNQSDRPKIPPPVVPPGHQRSASTGAPVTIPGAPLHSMDNEKLTGSQNPHTGLHPDNGAYSHSQLQQAQDKLSHSSLNRHTIARPPRPMPPPPPPPDNTIVEQTHL